MGWTLKTTTGGDPLQIPVKLLKGVEPTQEDLLYAGQRQRTRILERTARGVDVDGAPFAPYSRKGPYYYYPNGRVGNSQFSDRQLKAAVKRLHGKLSKGKPGLGTMALTRTGRGIRFESYAAFKSWLGRNGVDLRGPRAPHMLQAIIVKAESVKELVLGIYGDVAKRATGHNEGAGHLPQRRFFGASAADIKQMGRDIYDRILLRVK